MLRTAAGIQFPAHNSGAYWRPNCSRETLGAGCAFLDYDGDGWQDILLVNGMDWPGHKRQRSHAAALSEQPQRGPLRDATRKRRALDVEMYGMGVAVGDYDNDGFPGHFQSLAWGKSRPFSATPAKELSLMPRRASGLFRAPGASALPRCGLTMTGMDCWTSLYATMCAGPLSTIVFCSLDGSHKSYCTPEAYSRRYLLALPQSRQRNFRRRDRHQRHF